MRRTSDNEPLDESVVPVEVTTWKAGQVETGQSDWLSSESPLEIRVNGKAFVMTMRTPGHDDELAIGYLCTEGILERKAQITAIRLPKHSDDSFMGQWLEVDLDSSITIDQRKVERSTSINSSCGVCGKTSIAGLTTPFPPLATPVVPWVSPEILVELPNTLHDYQKNFHRTGGLHAAGIFNAEGDLIVCREDVGRHNAVDKVIGYGLMHGLLPFEERILVVSGRTSFEILQKALAARISVIVSVSAPSSFAVRFARDNGQTLAGFVRKPSFNTYTHPQQIQFKGYQAGGSPIPRLAIDPSVD